MKKNRFLKLTGIILCLVMLCAIGVMTASAQTEITTVHIYGIDAPNPGNPPDFEGYTGSDAYSIMYGEHGVIWCDDDGGADMTCDSYTSFADGGNYRVKVYIEPEAGYKFPDNPSDMVAFFGSGNAKANVYNDPSNGYYVQFYFDVCGEITNVYLAPKAPVADAKADFSAVGDGRFYSDGNLSPEKNGVKWYDETTESHLVYLSTNYTFKAHHTYTVTYSLKTTESEFGNTKAWVNGEEAEVSWANPGAITVKYTFAPLCEPQYVGPQPPSCDKTGHIGYYACSCGKWYWDEKATDPVADKEEIVIPPTGAHTGGTATCKAQAVCTVCKKAYGTVNKNNHTSLITLPAKAATYKTTGLTAGKKCTACDTVTLKQNTVAVKKLSAVSGIKATPSSTSLKLTWNKVTGAEKYELQYIGGGKTLTKTVTANTVTLSSLKTGTAYTVKIKAVAGSNKGAEGSLATSTKPSKVKIKKAKSTKRKIASLTWGKVTGATRYQVQYSTSKSFKKKTTKTTKSTKLTIKKLKSKKNYYVRVRAYKVVDGTKVYSSWSTVKKVKIK